MARFDLFSKRQQDLAKSGHSDVYNYDVVTSAFRTQLINIAKSAFGPDSEYVRNRGHVNNMYWGWVSETYSHEKGISPIGGSTHSPETIRLYYLSANDQIALDLTEIIIYKINEIEVEKFEYLRSMGRVNTNALKVDEVNYRLREAGMGYQFESGHLTRIDSQLIHNDVVKPALSLLAVAGFEGAQDEFLKAHAHYRAGQNKEAISMAANSLESTFKAIFSIKKWEYNKGSRISDLMKVAKGNGLWPDYLDNSFDQLVATLQNGLPKIRDNDASHGQGAVPKEVPSYLAGYALHLAASKIVFLVAAAKALP